MSPFLCFAGAFGNKRQPLSVSASGLRV